MRIMRSNYDKYRRCPMWSGPAWRNGREEDYGKCVSGMLDVHSKWSRWKLLRCPKCGTVVLPNITRNLDPEWWIDKWKYRQWLKKLESGHYRKHLSEASKSTEVQTALKESEPGKPLSER